MKSKQRTFIIIASLLTVSVLIYLLQVYLFKNPKDTVFYIFQDLAFVPISVLLVTLGLNALMVQRERQMLLEKVSIVVNEFFAETGMEVIMGIKPFISNLDEISPGLQMDGHWQDKDFLHASAFLAKIPAQIDLDRSDLPELNRLLQDKKKSILRLFENSNLMEHDRFTDMLWALYHVCDELRSRNSLEDLPAADRKHIGLDIERAIRLLLIEWIDAMRQQKTRYPYLYSLAVRKAPFGKNSVIFIES